MNLTACSQGKPFIIAKAGKAQVKVVPLDAPVGKKARRIGFLEGQISVPDDFNTMGSTEIKKMFGGRK